MDAVSEFGPSAYYVFFMTLEILTKEKAFDRPLEMKWNSFCWRFPKISKNKIKSILNFFCDRKRFIIHFPSDMISVYCQKLSDLSSTYQKNLRNETQPYDNIRREKKEERRKKIREEKKPEAKASPLFQNLVNLFFNEYFRLTKTDYIPHKKDFAQLKLLLKNDISSERMYKAIHNCFKDEFHRNNFGLAYVCANFSKLENWKPKELNYFQKEQFDSENRKKKKAEVEQWKKEKGYV